MIPKFSKVSIGNSVQVKTEGLKASQKSSKVTQSKFARQKQIQQTMKKSLKQSVVYIPNLNFKVSHADHQKFLSRVQSNETKIPLTTYRNSDEQINIIQSELNIQSPTKSKNHYSPMDKLIKSKISKQNSDSIVSSTEKEQLLLLQIKQLKRQNTFLKKKIRDLRKQVNGGFLPEEYENNGLEQKNDQSRKMRKKGALKLKSQSLHLSVNLYFQQIRTVLHSLTHLFRLDLSQQQVLNFHSTHGQTQIEQLNDDICPLRKHQILKKYYLNRKLERLALQEEDKRYEMLLGIFMEYYTFKEQSEKKVVEAIDKMVGYMNDLNGWLIQRAYAKKMKSEGCNQLNTERDEVSTPPKFQGLKVPSNMVNYVSKQRGMTLSPTPKTKEI